METAKAKTERRVASRFVWCAMSLLIRSVFIMGLELLRNSIRTLFRYTRLGNEGLKLRKQMPNIAYKEKADEVETTVDQNSVSVRCKG